MIRIRPGYRNDSAIIIKNRNLGLGAGGTSSCREMVEREHDAHKGSENESILLQKEPSVPWTPRRVEMPHIQGLRFVAMLWIFGFHYFQYEPSSVLDTFFNHRPLDLFTVISGFATHLAYGRKQNLGGPGYGTPFIVNTARCRAPLCLTTYSCIVTAL